MTKLNILITGANGEVGSSLIKRLHSQGETSIVALDLHAPKAGLGEMCEAFYQGDIMDEALLAKITESHCFHTIYHLAGLLSSTGEKKPDLAHMVNVEGSRNILKIARAHCDRLGKPVVFVFSSSIAAFGVTPEDDQSKPVNERQYLTPSTMYGVNKLYVEQLGRYYAEFYKKSEDAIRIDFRCVRFPGLISPDTVPSGGTSDYGPEMLHAAAKGEAYRSFVKPDTTMPFMVMSDAILALTDLAGAPAESIRQRIYNVTSFSVSAEEIQREVMRHFPNANISYEPNLARQAIVDSWPRAMDDSAARQEWGWSPEYGFEDAFAEVLVPKIKARYQS